MTAVQPDGSFFSDPADDGSDAMPAAHQLTNEPAPHVPRAASYEDSSGIHFGVD
jgi:hypothetical protein